MPLTSNPRSTFGWREQRLARAVGCAHGQATTVTVALAGTTSAIHTCRSIVAPLAACAQACRRARGGTRCAFQNGSVEDEACVGAAAEIESEDRPPTLEPGGRAYAGV